MAAGHATVRALIRRHRRSRKRRPQNNLLPVTRNQSYKVTAAAAGMLLSVHFIYKEAGGKQSETAVMKLICCV